MRNEWSVEQRARELLAETALFDELGLGQLAAASRRVARDVLELVPLLEAERSARVATQARAEMLQGIIGKASYDQVSAAVAAGADA